MLSPLQIVRTQYLPIIPDALQEIQSLSFFPEKINALAQDDAKIQKAFPKTYGQPLMVAKTGNEKERSAKRVGVVFSGGQAAGGHNVIAGLFDALKLLHQQSILLGFLDGPSGIIEGKRIEITEELLAPYRNQGGFDLIGSGRTKIDTEEQLLASLATVQNLKLDGLVIIGGDDSNTNAAVLAEFFLAKGCATKVIGVPKTIDGDLKNPYVAISFGFDTAAKIFSEMIGNIGRDAISAKKYYHFIKLMGRSASHIALECALATQPTYAFIGEEVSAQKKTLEQIARDLADLICRRSELGKNYGIILVPEGLIEFIPEVKALIKELNKILAQTANVDLNHVISGLTTSSGSCFKSLPEAIQKQLLFTRDPHGNVQVSLIETEQLLADAVEKELQKRQRERTYKGKFNVLRHFFGYEGRSGLPSNFDCNYCYSLGYAATLLIDEGLTGYMASVQGLHLNASKWKIGGVPLTSLMGFEVRKGREKAVVSKALVDLEGRAFSHFSCLREKWAIEDQFRSPGPIQFFGSTEITDSIPLSLAIEENIPPFR